MDFELMKLLFDTGLFILIWIVQLVIYPSFYYYSEEQLKRWHPIYKVNISIVVLPLMMGQLVIYVYSAYFAPCSFAFIMLTLVGLTWLVTFLVAVPLHDKVEKLPETMVYRKKLVHTNWARTALWSIIFIISYISYAK